MRAAGLFLGAEIVRGGDPLAADAHRCARIVNHLREGGVLISATGTEGHVLKIRPPLCFGMDHMALFLDALEGVLSAEA